MRTLFILEYLYEAEQTISSDILAQNFHVSTRTLRSDIRELNETGSKNGFEIILKRNIGYQLVVSDYDKFQTYYISNIPKIDIDNQKQRITYIEMLLFLENDYITIDEIAEKLQVSRSTIQKDLKALDKHLFEFNLSLESKPHYGIQIVGDESDYRKAISKLLSDDKNKLMQTVEYNEFHNIIDKESLKLFLYDRLIHYDINMSDIAFENIVSHILILAFRVSIENYATTGEDMELSFPETSNQVFYNLSDDILGYLTSVYGFSIPEIERDYLAKHLIGKAQYDNLTEAEKSSETYHIFDLLKKLDERFLTNMSSDEELIQALVGHILPLKKRIYLNVQLQNPLIDDIYSRYANVFNIAIQFLQELNQDSSFPISRDEIGYIATYFAAHQEKTKKENLSKIKKVLLVAQNGSAVFLLKEKLQGVFPDAQVITTTGLFLDAYKSKQFDIVLSTMNLEPWNNEIPFFYIAHFLDEAEIKKIKSYYSSSSFAEENYEMDNEAILALFKEELFYKGPGEDYLTLLKDMSQKTIDAGFAVDNFKASVIERELSMNTIYSKGIAGPHSMQMFAIEDSIAVSILDPPIHYEDKKVNYVFLINLKRGHLDLHKKISGILIKIIDSTRLRARIFAAKTHEEFMDILEGILD